MEKFTRCPGCKTIFRVTPQQLALREGQVRCGHCRTVFNGLDELVSLAPNPDATREQDEGDAGPPTVTLRSAAALHPVTTERPTTTQRPPPVAPRAPSAERTIAPERASRAAPVTPEVDYENRFAWDKPKKPKRRTGGSIAAAILLVVLLVAQAVWHFRDGLAAHSATLRPLLTRMCAVAGCAIRPLRDVAGLSIEASDLQADPAHRGLLVLSATIRNRAGHPLAYPYLELTLTDAQDQVVVRRALMPSDYAGGTADLNAGIAVNGEVAVKLFIDASATTQAGYRLYLFYP